MRFEPVTGDPRGPAPNRTPEPQDIHANDVTEPYGILVNGTGELPRGRTSSSDDLPRGRTNGVVDPYAAPSAAVTSTAPPLPSNGRHQYPPLTGSPGRTGRAPESSGGVGQPGSLNVPAAAVPTQRPAVPKQRHVSTTERQSDVAAPHRTDSADAPARPRVDFAVVRELRRELTERITAWQRGRDFTSDEEVIERARLAAAVVSEYADAVRRAGTPMPATEERILLEQVTAELVGLGRLQTLLTDESIEEVHILGCDLVRITRRNGVVDWAEPIADSDEELVEILQAAARRVSTTERSLSTSKPTLDLQLPDGSRLAAVFLVSSRPYAVIRKHNTLDVSLDDVSGARADLDEMLDVLIRDFLRAAMRAGLNIMVAGLAGAGKTTVIRALMDEIPPDEPFVLLEESRELLPARRRLKHRAVMSFESREGHGERGLDGRPAGEVTIADLIPVALRMGVLRIIVGEVRSREIVPMLQAMTTSRGSMCTIHARTPAGVSERIIELALSHGREMTVDQARRMAGNALDLIVYVTVEDETAIGGRKHRFISHIEEVIGAGENNRITTTTIFGPGPDGRAIPRHLPERVREQLLRVGYDPRLLSRYIEAGTGAWRRPKHSQLRRPA